MKSLRRTLPADLLASIVVFLVALPLCMGIAIASGVPAERGLVTGILGGLVVGVLAGSPLQVSGPAAGLAVLVWQMVDAHGLAILGPVVLLGGLVQIAAGALKLGGVFRAVAPAVVHGMLAGIGVLIFAAQIHVMVDDKPRGSGLANLASIPEAFVKGALPGEGGLNHQLAALTGIAALVAILAWNHFKPKRLAFVPGPLVGVIAATLLASLAGFTIARVAVPESLADAVALTSFSELGSVLASPALLGSALALAFIASAETLLCATAVDSMHDGPRTNYDKELRAQGIGNFLCGLFGALPMTGVIVRSSANVDAGAKTRASAILHGAWLLAFVVALPFILRQIPTAALAAVLVYTGVKLVNVAAMKKLWSVSRTEFGIYAATLAGIVVFDLLTGVVAGFGLSVLRLVFRLARFSVSTHLHEPGKAAITLSGVASFLSLPKLAAALEKLPEGAEITFHLDRVLYIDHACSELIASFEQRARRRGGAVIIDWEAIHRRAKGLHAVV
ncbi:MAG: SulP family inorganic anion transporter [Polyangiaceae bacterium]|nr:SulP family inorganic anion transporter [Polyangiaceae bacterium]